MEEYSYADLQNNTDPWHRYDRYSVIDEASLMWLTNNILNVDDYACDRFRQHYADSEDGYLYGGNYYIPAGFADGYFDEKMEFSQAYYLGEYVFVQADFNIYDGPYIGAYIKPTTVYAVLKQKELNGVKYWSVYSFCEKGFIYPSSMLGNGEDYLCFEQNKEYSFCGTIEYRTGTDAMNDEHEYLALVLDAPMYFYR